MNREDDDLNTARGICLGVIGGIVIWIVGTFTILALLRYVID